MDHPTLETERLMLRPMGPDDAETLFVAEVASTDVIGLVIGGRRSVETVEDPELARAYPRELASLAVANLTSGPTTVPY